MAKRFQGWTLFWTITAMLGAMALLTLSALGWTTDCYRLVIRETARTSLALFLTAFLASSFAARWPGGWSRWLRANRRYVGLSFAMSHAIHLAAIVALARTDPGTFGMLSTKGSIIAGSTGYLAIALLASTSFDRAVAWLGPRLWQRLHTVGAWYIWVSFVFTNGKRIPESGWYALPVALLAAALVLKLATSRSKRAVTA